MQRHPYMTARDIAEHFGCAEHCVAWARKHYGRYEDPQAARLCVACGERVVWAECRPASRMHLCKGCYLVEKDRRTAEERESARLRQRVHKDRLAAARAAGTGAGQSGHGEGEVPPGDCGRRPGHEVQKRL